MRELRDLTEITIQEELNPDQVLKKYVNIKNNNLLIVIFIC